jgi:hypothetical protein
VRIRSDPTSVHHGIHGAREPGLDEVEIERFVFVVGVDGDDRTARQHDFDSGLVECIADDRSDFFAG